MPTGYNATAYVRERIAMLEVGTQAPDFTLPDQNGQMRTLSEWHVLTASDLDREHLNGKGETSE